MAIISNTVNYLDGDVRLEGFFAYDDAIEGKRPAVLISHAWGGRDQFVEQKALKLADLGYVGFALDMYGDGKTGSGPEENAQLMQPWLDDRSALQRRINAALYAVKLMPWVDESKIAAIGFCFGGLCVLDLARSGADICGVISFHGLLIPPANQSQSDIKAKVMVLHGYDDPMVPVEQVNALQQEFSSVGADWQVHIYGNTMHAFTNPNANDPGFGTVYQPSADKRSWRTMAGFLSEIFA